MPQIMKVLEYRDSEGDVMSARVPPGGDSAIEWGSQLTVRESQKAIFLRDGKPMCIFEPGRYVLTTQNIPILTKFLTGLVYGRTPFLADVFFIGTGLYKDLRWGTPEPIPFTDPVFRMVRLRANGKFSVQVKDPSLFQSKLVKTMAVFRQSDVEEYMRGMIVSALTDTLGELAKGLMELPKLYREIGIGVKSLLADEFATCGLEIVDLNVLSITPPEEVQKAIDQRSSMSALGNMAEFQQYQMGKSLPDMAAQPGGLGGQLGMAMMVPQLMQQAMRPQAPAAPTPGVQIIEDVKPDPFAKIKQLKELLDIGAITPDEFNRKKEELLQKI